MRDGGGRDSVRGDARGAAAQRVVHGPASDGKEHTILMGCYGLGINRIVAAIVEQHHDENGIQWPASIAPYSVHLITVNQEDPVSCNAADQIYEALCDRQISCLYDDRKERAGVKFKDADLVGNPVQVIISDRNLSKGQVELHVRKTSERTVRSVDQIVKSVQVLLEPVLS